MTPEMQKVIVDAGKYAQDAVLKFQLENAEAAKKELIAGGLVVFLIEEADLVPQGCKMPHSFCADAPAAAGDHDLHGRSPSRII